MEVWINNHTQKFAGVRGLVVNESEVMPQKLDLGVGNGKAGS